MLMMSLVPYLREHGATQVVDLAEKFGVEANTIRRLVRFLGVAGVPGETMTYQHEDLFDIDWDALELHDLVSLTRTVAVDDTPRFSSSETAAMIAGLHVLTPLLPEDMQRVSSSAAAKLALVQPVGAVSGAVSITEDPVQENIGEITSAVSRGVRLSFDYRAVDGSLTQRTVEPLLLSQAGGRWYLRAYCLDRGAERTFMLDRMREPQALSVSSLRQPSEETSMPGVEGAEVVAVLRLTRTALHSIADFAPRVLSESADGWLLAEVLLLHPAVAVRLVQAAPGEVIVEAPEASRIAVQEWAERALACYGD